MRHARDVKLFKLQEELAQQKGMLDLAAKELASRAERIKTLEAEAKDKDLTIENLSFALELANAELVELRKAEPDTVTTTGETPPATGRIVDAPQMEIEIPAPMELPTALVERFFGGGEPQTGDPTAQM